MMILAAWDATTFIVPALSVLAVLLGGYLYYKGDKRYVLKTDFVSEARRLETAAIEEAKRIETAATEEAKRIERAATLEIKRVEEGSRERYTENHTAFKSIEAKIDGVVTSRIQHDQQMQAQLTSITSALGQVQGQLSILIPLIKDKA